MIAGRPGACRGSGPGDRNRAGPGSWPVDRSGSGSQNRQSIAGHGTGKPWHSMKGPAADPELPGLPADLAQGIETGQARPAGQGITAAKIKTLCIVPPGAIYRPFLKGADNGGNTCFFIFSLKSCIFRNPGNYFRLCQNLTPGRGGLNLKNIIRSGNGEGHAHKFSQNQRV